MTTRSSNDREPYTHLVEIVSFDSRNAGAAVERSLKSQRPRNGVNVFLLRGTRGLRLCSGRRSQFFVLPNATRASCSAAKTH